LAKIRVYELAKELGAESKDVLEQASALGLDAKTASSGLEAEAAELIRLAFAERVDAAAAPPPAPEPEPELPPSSLRSEPEADLELIEIEAGLSMQALAEALGKPVAEVVKTAIGMGAMVNAGQAVPDELLEPLGERFGFLVSVRHAAPPPSVPVPSLRPLQHAEDRPEDLKPRGPVVTVMGHVDHGKTSLLDRIRQSSVVESEAGRITQHIGAYQVPRDTLPITFIDTPGHEAFTALRARGANVTDVVVLVVAADDGVMPQTIEAISHAQAAGVPIIVAINKIDTEGADPYGVRAALTAHGVIVEQLGGEVVSVEVSALTGQGIDHLLEVIELTSELETLTTNFAAPAEGAVIESNLDKGKGAIGTVIVQRGTLSVGNALVAGPVAARVRAMTDFAGKPLRQAGPSTPVLITGWTDVPRAGDRFQVVADDRTARELAAINFEDLRNRQLVVPSSSERLSQLLSDLRSQDQAELRLIVKVDTHGSLEALRESITNITRDGSRIVLLHGGIGGINETDVTLAEASGAVVLGFNVRPDANARRAAEAAGVEIRTYRVIYQLLEEVEKMLVGLLAPQEMEDILGSAEVREVFRAKGLGNVAGSYVTEGEITRGDRIRLVRDGVVVYDGTIASVRRFKDDVRSVSFGYECGIGLENFKDVKQGDLLEAYRVRQVAAT